MNFAAQSKFSDIRGSRVGVVGPPVFAMLLCAPVLSADSLGNKFLRGHNWLAPVLQHLSTALMANQLIEKLDGDAEKIGRCRMGDVGCGM